MQEQGLAKSIITCTFLEFAIVINMGSIDHFWVPIDLNDSNQSIVLQLFNGMTTASGTRPHVHKQK